MPFPARDPLPGRMIPRFNTSPYISIMQTKRRAPEEVAITDGRKIARELFGLFLIFWGLLVLLCGHYEGIDERVLEEIVTDYVSAGDYVLTGGELPAMMIVDAVSRLIPGVLHNDVSAEFESFQDNLLEYPQYSRPEIWHDRQVPPILLSGHHANVEKWRREQSVIRTAKWRPDLLEDAELTMKERELAEEIIENREKDLKNEE